MNILLEIIEMVQNEDHGIPYSLTPMAFPKVNPKGIVNTCDKNMYLKDIPKDARYTPPFSETPTTLRVSPPNSCRLHLALAAFASRRTEASRGSCNDSLKTFWNSKAPKTPGWKLVRGQHQKNIYNDRFTTIMDLLKISPVGWNIKGSWKPEVPYCMNCYSFIPLNPTLRQFVVVRLSGSKDFQKHHIVGLARLESP